MINKLDLQTFLFEQQPTRMELLEFIPTLASTYRVGIYRNHSFELIENTITPFLEYSGIGVDFVYSSYDDSLSFLELDLSVDLVILWLDLSLYDIPDLNVFLHDRIKYLRKLFQGNILFVPCAGKCAVDTSDLQVEHYCLSSLHSHLADKFYDLRLEPFAGTKLSHVANLAISRDLGLNYLPALLTPGLKGIVVDLDNTLYSGVLGEDGLDGVELTAGHRQLQEKLKELAQQGFFLCIASKNDERDVFDLFKQRADFPLKMDDFAKVCANWNHKADSIHEIAQTLNVATDSLLFIDDNLGELASVMETHPSINLIWAKDDALLTLEVLSNYPGLLKLSFKPEDRIRKADTLANQARTKLQSSLSKEDYIKALNMSLLFEVDSIDRIDRVAELSNKTNQFIFSYGRYTRQQIEQFMNDDNSAVVSVALSDKLSDSGVIGVVIARKHGAVALLQECFVSCRALGRGIDEAIVLGAVNTALDALNTDQLKVEFTAGERNAPAERFCDDYLHAHRTSAKTFHYELPTNLISVNFN